jgi:hypothetical protein
MKRNERTPPISSLSCFGSKINRGHQQPLGIRLGGEPTDAEKGKQTGHSVHSNFLVEFVGSINVRTKRKTNNKNSARMSMQCMLYSVGGGFIHTCICQLAMLALLRFYAHPSLAGP